MIHHTCQEDFLMERIKSAAKKGEWTQQDLAEFIGVSRQALWEWQTGRSIPTIKPIQLLKLAVALELSLEEIIRIFHPSEVVDPMMLRQQLRDQAKKKK